MNARAVFIVMGMVGTALAVSQRKRISVVANLAFDAAKEQLFYVVIPARTRPYSAAILNVVREQSISPFLIVAFMERESRSGEALTPRGPGGKGDAGHGHGLMQIDDRSFGPWIAANPWWDPRVNITKGARVLRDKVRFFLLSPRDPADPRPLDAFRARRAGIAAYNAGEGNVIAALRRGESPDAPTHSGSYSEDVLRRAREAERGALV